MWSKPTPSLGVVPGGADHLLKVADVARILGVSTATVYTLCDRGELRHVRILNAIRVAPADLATFVERHAKEPHR